MSVAKITDLENEVWALTQRNLELQPTSNPYLVAEEGTIVAALPHSNRL